LGCICFLGFIIIFSQLLAPIKGFSQGWSGITRGGASGQRIFDLMLRTASGEPTRSEAMGFGAQEFAPWVLGATM
jgi:ABC-type multidrug transport system fused ATPase/permease subunit